MAAAALSTPGDAVRRSAAVATAGAAAAAAGSLCTALAAKITIRAALRCFPPMLLLSHAAVGTALTSTIRSFLTNVLTF